MPEPIGWIIERRSRPGFLAGFKSGFAELTLEPWSVRVFASPEPHLPNNRLNDAKADSRGGIWAGSMDQGEREASGSLYRIDPDLSWRRVDSGYCISNGPTMSPDGKKLYHSDSALRTIYCFDVSPAGELEHKRVWAKLEPGAFPDGMTTDAEGGIWVAVWGGSCVRRFSPEGVKTHETKLPVSQVSNCVFGGEALDRLFVTTAATRTPHEPEAGGLFELDSGFCGLPAQLFAG
jgi:xylono-1,5-lactonase